jgi:LPS sulfotransferase NodH
MHNSSLIYTSRFDFPWWNGLPRKQLMIASVPRSGSTAFCVALWRTGLLGAPLEYLNFPLIAMDPRWSKLLRHERKFWRELRGARTGLNGVFSYKFFVQNYVKIMDEKPKLLSRIAPTHVVYLTRADKLAQAISYSRAIRSGAWFWDHGTGDPCGYDESHIQSCLEAISGQETAWEHVFKITHVQPLRVFYEEFLEAPGSTIQAIIEYVVPGSRLDHPLQLPEFRVQRDSVSDDWKQRFLARAIKVQTASST